MLTLELRAVEARSGTFDELDDDPEEVDDDDEESEEL